MTVLIVDDEVPLLKNLRGFLTSLEGRFHVLTATSAEEGLQTLEQDEPVDVLLTDVRLPGMDGIELVRRARSRRPRLPVVVMSAFGNASVKRRAHAEGALRFLEKPVDLNDLREVLEQVTGAEPGWSGTVGGLDIFDVTQLLAMSGRSLAVRVTFGRRSGMLRFRDGQLVHAAAGRLVGEEAFFEMARWTAGTFEEMPESGEASPEPTIQLPLSQLMIEAARRRDEAKREASERSSPATGDASGGDTKPAVPGPAARQRRDRHDTEEERHMAIKDHLQEFTGIEGFKAAAVFTAQGEMLESETVGKYDIKSVGMFANNALLNAQKATDQMGVGRGNLMQIRAPQASIMMRCLNEATDFAANKEGKAHFHTVIVMDPEGNMGMAAMILDKVVGKIADELR
ncbi:MAG: response regulator [Acidobacteria bacterium]|nr:response regulator [Acidobacteriota bacterium]